MEARVVVVETRGVEENPEMSKKMVGGGGLDPKLIFVDQPCPVEPWSSKGKP